MKMKKLNKLFDNDFKIVENKGKILLVPLAVIVLTLIMGFIHLGTRGSFMSVGMDFTGGYRITIKLGATLTDGNYDFYADRAKNAAETLTKADGEPYGLKIADVSSQGEGGDAAIVLKFLPIGSDDEMNELNDRLQKRLTDVIFLLEAESHVFDGNVVTVTYGIDLIGDYPDNIAENLRKNGFAAGAPRYDAENAPKRVSFALSQADIAGREADFVNALSISDAYSGEVSNGGQTGAVVSGEILARALLAVAVALILMFLYIFIRFEFLSGIASVLALFHDLLMMFCFMIIFHIEITNTFMAAVITILGYSINNSIIIFDRVRENVRNMAGKRVAGRVAKPAFIANKSVKDTVWRSINTTVTTLIMIAMVAIIGVWDIRIFALPLIAGLLAGAYSSVLIAPAVWAALKVVFPGKEKVVKEKKQKAVKENLQV